MFWNSYQSISGFAQFLTSYLCLLLGFISNIMRYSCKLRKILLTFIILKGLSLSVIGNNFFNRFGGAVHRGYVMAHDSEMTNLSRDPFPFFHFTLTGQTQGHRQWHHTYNFPSLGFDFIFGDLGYPEVLGRSFAFLPHIRLNLFQSEIVNLRLQHGLGLAYLTRTYDSNSNEENIAIGTAMNLALNMSFEAEWQLAGSLHLVTGFSLSHYSNGKVETPNKGLNIPSVKLGMFYSFQDPPTFMESPVHMSPDRVRELVVIGSAGFTSSYPPGLEKSARYAITSTYHFPIREKHRLGIGYDFFYSYPEKRMPTENHDLSNDSPFVNHGIHLSFQQDFSRMAFIIHSGFYLWDPDDYRRYVYYHRAGFRYNLIGNLLLNLTLKTHLFRAEFIEWGVGYRIQ